ncbi:LPXTG-motif cell wall anchor domain-containing protein/signal peptide-containing protein, YSIRK family [Granulicatella balaenopterae]|uniref:LPXTG-motif cell wall anchor domain-containing protein/signal peptide-containing protein, YSIRK family n=1 Tax=Granulicatella balaenopterae TaxID=137733 RepID=A0A1H9IEB8_9LACT|nr:Rib/alpha-like domain-containing protein [Granulicatella balaenopterae]SEQ72940.1 LPXTG-motif cell wall anchor domain-containing protein/signal peptide-containing protein, YSIRK family [Granulicatella balaenopterae]
MQRKNMRETKQKFTIKKFKVGVGSVLIGTIMSGVMLPTAVLASELDSSTPLENSFLVEAPNLAINQGNTPKTQEETLDSPPTTPEVTTTPETPTLPTMEIPVAETNSAETTPEKTITENTPTTIDKKDDDDKYEPVAKTLWVSPGATITEEMILNQVSVPRYPHPEKLTKKIDNKNKIPTPEQLIVGAEFKVEVEVTYADGSDDDIDVIIKVRKTDADKYTPTATKIEVIVGEKITPDMIKEHITIPADAPIKEVKYGTTPPTDIAGDKAPIKVTIIYQDGSTDIVEVPVHVTEKPITPTDADKYTPTATKIVVPQGMNILDEMVKEHVTLPEDIEATITKITGSRDTMTPGDKDPLIVEVTYPDGTIDTVEVPLCVTDIPDNEVYEPTTEEIEVTVGTEITKDMVKEHVTLPEDVKATIGAITNIPDTSTHGDKDPIQVEVNYADGSCDLVKVEVHVLDPNSPDPDKPVDPDNGDGTKPDKPINPDNGGDSTDSDKPINPDNGGDSTDPDKPINPDNGDDSTDPTKPNQPVDSPQTDNHNSNNNQNNTSKPVNNVTPLKSSSMSYMRLPQTSAQTLLEFATIGILMTGIGAVCLAKRKK